MKQQLYYFIILIGLLTACQNKKATQEQEAFAQISVQKELKLKRPQRYELSANLIRKVKEGEDIYYYIWYFPHHFISKYKLSEPNKFKKIPLPVKNADCIDFEVCTPDSIMLFLSGSGRYSHDSSIVCINEKGEIRKVFPLEHPNIIGSKYHSAFLNDMRIKQSSEACRKILDTTVFLQNRSGQSIEESVFKKQKLFMVGNNTQMMNKATYRRLPLAMYYDFETMRIVDSKLWYPDLKEKVYYHPDAYEPSYMVNDSMMMITFSYTPKIWLWNYENNTSRLVSVASRFADSIPISSSPVSSENWNKETIYSRLMYLKNQHLYLRGVRTSERQGEQLILVVCDDNLNYIGEFIYPKGISYHNGNQLMEQHLKDSLLLIEYSDIKIKMPFDAQIIQSKLDSISYEKNLQKLKKDSMEKVCNISNITGRDCLDFLPFARQKMQIEDSTAIIIVIDKAGCYSCNNYVLNFLKQNSVLFFKSEKPIYILYRNQDGTRKSLEANLSDFSLKGLNQIILDTTSLYENYLPYSSANPRMIFIKNNKVKADSLYMPAQIENLPKDFQDYFNQFE